ncbi:MAG: hypothetical protein ACFFG0_05140 [Candidatus Thorarchaeota archaeon]
MQVNNNIPIFDHSPGEHSNRVAMQQVREKENFYETGNNLKTHENRNEKTKKLSSAAKIMIVVCGVMFFVFVVGDAAFSWDVFEDKVAAKIGFAEGTDEDTDNHTKAIIIIVIGAFAGVALVGSNLLKQPWTKNIPSLDFNKKMDEGPGNFIGRTHSLSHFRPKEKKDNSVWAWFIIGLLLTGGTGYVLYKMSVEREQFQGTLHSYTEQNTDNSLFEGFEEVFKDENETGSADTPDKLPISVWLPLLFYAAEVATGWALIPMFLIIGFWSKTNRLTNKREAHKLRATESFDEVITIYPAYTGDIEDYNKRYKRMERAITPNPELKEILHIYDKGGNALTRVERKNTIEMFEDSNLQDKAEPKMDENLNDFQEQKDESFENKQNRNPNHETEQNPEQEQENAKDTNHNNEFFFDTEAI